MNEVISIEAQPADVVLEDDTPVAIDLVLQEEVRDEPEVEDEVPFDQ